jgi:tRNA(Ile2) C34 agmatinyltransferase TiaS
MMLVAWRMWNGVKEVRRLEERKERDRLLCDYCGGMNAEGDLRCRFCGAPLR